MHESESQKEKLNFAKKIYSLPGSHASPEVDALLLQMAGKIKSSNEIPGHIVYEESPLETDENLKRYYSVDRNANQVHGLRCAHVFKCKICDKRTNQFVNMKVHIRSHLGIKPYKCSICNKSFTTSSNAKLHLKTRSCIRIFS